MRRRSRSVSDAVGDCRDGLGGFIWLPVKKPFSRGLGQWLKVVSAAGGANCADDEGTKNPDPDERRNGAEDLYAAPLIELHEHWKNRLAHARNRGMFRAR